MISYNSCGRLAAMVLALALLTTPALAVAALTQPSPQPLAEASRIVAVVNGEVISNGDVENRTRLFAMSTGLPMSPDVLDRLKPQIRRQLIDERLRMQEVQRRHIVVPDQQIATAIREIETRNGLQPGALRQRLAAAGVSQRTLVDQIRTQIGWTQVLRDQLGDKVNINDQDVAEQERMLAQQSGKPEYRVGEIFIPIDDPANAADAQRFAETVITELRAGAPFPIVAAQFSQSQTALEGGELGWVQPNQLDPEVARLASEMPVGAISNPIKVPGGLSIVSLQGKREIGNDIGTALTMRQVFLPFDTPLNPQNPSPHQRQIVEKARSIGNSVHACEQMEQVAKANNSPRPADPGEVRLENVTPPAFRQLLEKLPLDRASQPLISNDGVAVVIICSREQKNMAARSKQEIQAHLLSERVELASRQLLRDLRRQASIQIRNSGA